MHIRSEWGKALTEEICGTTRVGRHKLRRENGVNYDARHILGIRNWRAAALDPVSYTHLDVYKRQSLFKVEVVFGHRG